MKDNIDKNRQEQLKKDLEVVKGKIVRKRRQSIIRKPLIDFLAENDLIPPSEDSIGGKGESESIIDILFKWVRIRVGSTRELIRINCLASAYQESTPEYWNIMKKYLKRFFCIRISQRRERPGRYDFGLWDEPRPENYPTWKEQREAWEKFCKVGKCKLNEREKYCSKTYYDEEKEKSSERIYDTLFVIGLESGWLHPENNFRWAAFFEPRLKEFWQWAGLEVNENLEFFLSKAVWLYHGRKALGRKYKISRYALFNWSHHSDYSLLKNQLINEVRVSKEFFEEIEDRYLFTQLQDLIPTLSRIVRPLFLVAHFLEEEDPDIYDYHRNLTKFYLSRIELGTAPVRRMLAYEIGMRRRKDFLFDAVWQDFLFDGKTYLQKPKEKKEKRGRPLNWSDSLFVTQIVNELKKYEAKLTEGVYKTTAKIINFLSKDERFIITGSYPDCGVDVVKRIYYRTKKKFEKREQG